MRHLDEGTLQAWLDRPRSGMDPEVAGNVEGHLQTCDVCADRLTELTHATKRAHALLSADTTVGEPADFEAVVARASVMERGRTLRTRWRAAAWAASIAVALGVGWVTNDLYRGRATRSAPPIPQSAAEVTSPAPPTVAPADRARMVSAPTGDEQSPTEGLPEPIPEPSPPTELVVAAPQAADTSAPSIADAELVAAAPQAADTIAPSVADSDVLVPIDVVPTPTVDPSLVAGTRPLPPPPPPSPDMDSLRAYQDRTAVAEPGRERDRSEPVARAVRGRVTDAQGRPLQAVQVAVDGLPIGALTGSDGTFLLLLEEAATPELTIVAQRIGYREARVDLALSGTDVAVADFQLSEQALALDEVVVTGAAPQPPNVTPAEAWESVWTAVSREEAGRAADFAPLLIPDLRVRAIELGALAGEPAVRIRQDVGDTTLTLLQWSAEASLSPPPAPPNGGSVATVVRDGVVVTATARLPADSLRSLVERARQE
jgi:hypothetical protein